nr:hypothetical protein [Tanacetum cinerariifolium]
LSKELSDEAFEKRWLNF